MKRSILALSTALALTAIPLAFPVGSSAAEEHSLKTLSTGIGADERVPHPGYSALLMFGKRESRALVADVKVMIFERRERGEKKILDTTSPGPWLFVDLPAGKYYVEAIFEGKKEGANFVVAGKGLKEVNLTWPG